MFLNVCSCTLTMDTIELTYFMINYNIIVISSHTRHTIVIYSAFMQLGNFLGCIIYYIIIIIIIMHVFLVFCNFSLMGFLAFHDNF